MINHLELDIAYHACVLEAKGAPITVATVMAAVYRERRARCAYTTIKTVMDRMHDKGVLNRLPERIEKRYYYTIGDLEALFGNHEKISRLRAIMAARNEQLL